MIVSADDLLEEGDGAMQQQLEVLVCGVEVAEGEQLFGVVEGHVPDGLFEVPDVHLDGF